jgi:uncharacterized protein (TIGR02996 family)
MTNIPQPLQSLDQPGQTQMSVVLRFDPELVAQRHQERTGGNTLDKLSRIFQTPTQFARDTKKFSRPENYDKIQDLPDNKELWAGANDWECGWTWAWIDSGKKDKDGNREEPEKFLEVDHSKCPACHGDPDSLTRKTEKQCQEYAKQQVSDWLKSVANTRLKMGRDGVVRRLSMMFGPSIGQPLRFAGSFDAPAPRTNLIKIPMTRISAGELTPDHIHAGLTGSILTIKHGPKDASGVGRKEDTYQVSPGSPADATNAYVLTGGKRDANHVTTVGKTSTQGNSCTCEGFKFGGGKWCKHICAMEGLGASGQLPGVTRQAQQPYQPPEPPSVPPPAPPTIQRGSPAPAQPVSWPVEEEPARKAIRHQDLRKRVDEQIAGTRLAYHLRQIEQRYKDKGPDEQHIATLAQQALSGETNAYAQLGQALEANGDHEFANAYRWHKVKQGLATDRRVSQALNNPRFDEHLSKILKSNHTKEEFLARMARLATTDFGREYARRQREPEQAKLIKDMDTWRHPAMQNIWRQLKAAAGVSGRNPFGDRLIAQSIMRHLFREEDRKQISKSRAQTKDLPTGKQVSWQDFFHMLPGFAGNPTNTRRAKKDTSNPERFKRDYHMFRGTVTRLSRLFAPVRFANTFGGMTQQQLEDFFRAKGIDYRITDPLGNVITPQQPQAPAPVPMLNHPNPAILPASPEEPKLSEVHGATSQNLGKQLSGLRTQKPTQKQSPIARHQPSQPGQAQPVGKPIKSEILPPESELKLRQETAGPVFHPQSGPGQYQHKVLRNKDRSLVATYTGATPEQARTRAQAHVDLHNELRRHFLQAEQNAGGRYDKMGSPGERNRMIWYHPANRELRAAAQNVLGELRKNAGIAPEVKPQHSLIGTGLKLQRDSQPVKFSHEEFHQTIANEPDNPFHKLVYADWLEEHGHEKLATSIREHPDWDLGKHFAIPGVVTVPRGSWKWQDAYAVRMYHPIKLRNGNWGYGIRGTLIQKGSEPQIRARGYERTRHGGSKIGMTPPQPIIAFLEKGIGNPDELMTNHGDVRVRPYNITQSGTDIPEGRRLAEIPSPEQMRHQGVVSKLSRLFQPLKLAEGDWAKTRDIRRPLMLPSNSQANIETPEDQQAPTKPAEIKPVTPLEPKQEPVDTSKMNLWQLNKHFKAKGIAVLDPHNRMHQGFVKMLSNTPGLYIGQVIHPITRKHLASYVTYGNKDKVRSAAGKHQELLGLAQVAAKNAGLKQLDIPDATGDAELLANHVWNHPANAELKQKAEGLIHGIRRDLGHAQVDPGYYRTGGLPLPATGMKLRRDGLVSKLQRMFGPIQMMHEDFHQTIANEPNEPFHKLVYADWLEEHGHQAVAELIRRELSGIGSAGPHPDRNPDGSTKQIAYHGTLFGRGPDDHPNLHVALNATEGVGPYASITLRGPYRNQDGYQSIVTHNTTDMDFLNRLVQEEHLLDSSYANHADVPGFIKRRQRYEQGKTDEIGNDRYEAYAWPGGYPMFHMTADGGVLCPECANENGSTDKNDPQWHITGSDINYEDNHLHCDNCNKKIESAYADPEDEEEPEQMQRQGVVNRLSKLFAATGDESQSIAPGLVAVLPVMGFPTQLAANSLNDTVSALSQAVQSGRRPQLNTTQRRDLEEMLRGLELLIEQQKERGQATPPDEIQKLHDLKMILAYSAGALVMGRDGKPINFSASGWPNTSSDLAAALQRMNSANHRSYVQAVTSAFNAMALTPHKIAPVLHMSSGSTQPAIAASIGRPVDKDSAEYAGSWLGTLAKQSGVLAFHSDPNGPDSLYHLEIPGSGANIQAALSGAGISQAILRPKNSGSFSITIHDPQRQMRKQVASVAKQFGTSIGETRGSGVQLGGDDPAEARAAYRGIIGKFEGVSKQ